MYLCLLDNDELAEGYSCVPPKQPINPCDFLTLVFGISWPGNGNRIALPAHFYEVPGCYPKLFHRSIIDAGFAMPNISLLSISYPQLYLLGHHNWFNSMVVMRRLSSGEDWRLVLSICSGPPFIVLFDLNSLYHHY